VNTFLGIFPQWGWIQIGKLFTPHISRFYNLEGEGKNAFLINTKNYEVKKVNSFKDIVLLYTISVTCGFKSTETRIQLKIFTKMLSLQTCEYNFFVL